MALIKDQEAFLGSNWLFVCTAFRQESIRKKGKKSEREKDRERQIDNERLKDKEAERDEKEMIETKYLGKNRLSNRDKAESKHTSTHMNTKRDRQKE